MSSRYGCCLTSSGRDNWTTIPVSTHRGVCPGESEGNNWTVDPMSIHRGKITMRSVSNTRNRPTVSDQRLQCCPVGNHRCRSTVSHIGRRQVKDCLCSIPGSTNLGSVSLLLSYFILVLGDWQVRSARRRPVRTTVVDNTTCIKVGMG